MLRSFILLAFSAFLLTSCNTEKGPRKFLIETNYGNMTFELFDETPGHRDNFVKLVEEDFYDGTLFHRVMNQFMIQGGDPDSRDAAPGKRLGMGGPGYTIPAEILPQFVHTKGMLAAARKGDSVNPQKESSGSQFYIVHGAPVNPQILEMLNQRRGGEFVYSVEQISEYASTTGTPNLDGDYTLFGRMISGFDVLDNIAVSETDRANRPLEDVVMKIKMLN
jgi:cyclophilin family peptidyl-prolyl cis-trans isomerase